MKAYRFSLKKIYKKQSDLQAYLEGLRKKVKPADRIIISYQTLFWKPIPWLDREDIGNLLNLAGFEVISASSRRVIARLKPFRYSQSTVHQFSVSIIIPARNEEGNIPKIIPSIPKLGRWQEIIFVEGHSEDQTWKKIQQITNSKYQTKHNNRITIKAFKQKGKGKADAVWFGLREAKGDILMIYDADRTVDTPDLKKFYNVLAKGIGEFANGNRLLYPMEEDAMQTLNKIGNQIFSWLFTWILGQRFKDTLCGTKAFFAHDFKKFKRSDTDPFGDFDLIFGAIRNNLKVVEIPVRYKERVYGSTNINRFYHGLLLIKMTLVAVMEFKLSLRQSTQ